MDAIHELRLDVQLVWNRDALMLLPAGVTKGTGVRAALAVWGVSPHSTVAVGDAENDHAPLDACELGVAVGNAVEALAGHADLVLAEPDGAGVARPLRGPVLSGAERVHSRRWQLALDTDFHGKLVTIPASQTNVLITGGAGRGKSYVAGLIAEQLIMLGYSVLVIDPEGDHIRLGALPGALGVGEAGRHPGPAELARLVDGHRGSLVLDLSLLAERERTRYLADLAPRIGRLRGDTGLPHWIVLDEAHGPLGRRAADWRAFQPSGWGYCLATFRPEELQPGAVKTMEWHIRLPQHGRGARPCWSHPAMWDRPGRSGSLPGRPATSVTGTSTPTPTFPGNGVSISAPRRAQPEP